MAPARVCGRTTAHLDNTRKRKGFSGLPIAASCGGRLFPQSAKDERRGDLDALRGFAMILGIVLHASLAYFSYPWPVQNPQQLNLLGVLYAAIHGFRMPLFFLLSGFFTMLILRRRGLQAMLMQRALRILLPLALATVTLLPLDRVVIAWAINRSTVAMADLNPLMGSVLAGDRVGLQQRLSDAEEGSETPLGAWWPVLLPLSVFLLFPLGLATIGQRHWAVLLQPAYAWGMSLSLIGLFRRFFPQERPAVRWLSDVSYWMYLIHLPLVIVA